MTSHPRAQRETGNRVVCFGHILRVTGDGHRGTSLSGISRSAFGSRLQVPAADGREADT
jgi:hypothetical protein